MTDKELVERLRLHANCMMDAAECKRCSILKRVETYTDTRTCTSCPLDGHCEFVKCWKKEGMQNVLDKQDKG